MSMLVYYISAVSENTTLLKLSEVVDVAYMPKKNFYMFLVFLFAVCCTASTADSSSSRPEDKGVTAGISAGYLFWDDRISFIQSFYGDPKIPEFEPGSYSLLNHAGVNLRLGYNIDEKVGLELSGGIYPHSIRFHYGVPGYQSISETRNSGEFSGNIKLSLLRQKNLGIYVIGGYGFVLAPAIGHANNPQDVFNLGGGMRIINDNSSRIKWALRMDARLLSVGMERAFSFDRLDAIGRLNFVQLTVGIEVVFLPAGNP